jgi:hypothetical protein
MSIVPPAHLRPRATQRAMPPGAGFLFAALAGAGLWAMILAAVM